MMSTWGYYITLSLSVCLTFSTVKSLKCVGTDLLNFSCEAIFIKQYLANNSFSLFELEKKSQILILATDSSGKTHVFILK